MADPDLEQAVQDFNRNVDMISTVFQRGTNEHNRAYLVLIAGFVKRTRHLELGKKLIKMVPREYIQNTMPKHMLEDDLFCATMCKLAEMYREAKMVEPPTFKAPIALIQKRGLA